MYIMMIMVNQGKIWSGQKVYMIKQKNATWDGYKTFKQHKPKITKKHHNLQKRNAKLSKNEIKGKSKIKSGPQYGFYQDPRVGNEFRLQGRGV